MAGQIERGHDFGDTLHAAAISDDVRACLEIGTLHGDGSTWVIAQALRASSGVLHSIELKDENYQRALRFYRDKDAPVVLHHGLSLTPEDYGTWEEYWQDIRCTTQEELEPGSYREWFEEEMELARAARRTDIARDLAKAEGSFDLVLLDGGEFASNVEFKVLEPYMSGWVFMDDTNGRRCIKNALAREWLLASPDWDVVRDEPGQRNGWVAAYKAT